MQRALCERHPQLHARLLCRADAARRQRRGWRRTPHRRRAAGVDDAMLAEIEAIAGTSARGPSSSACGMSRSSSHVPRSAGASISIAASRSSSRPTATSSATARRSRSTGGRPATAGRTSSAVAICAPAAHGSGLPPPAGWRCSPTSASPARTIRTRRRAATSCRCGCAASSRSTSSGCASRCPATTAST